MKIAIAGKMASGKTTLAEHIANKYGCSKVAIADKLKEIAALHTEEMLDTPEKLARELTVHAVDLIPDADILTFGRMMAVIGMIFYSFEPVDGKNRGLLQRLGHALHEFGDDIWINYLLDKMADIDDIVIDDVRYPIELDRLRQEGFTVVRLNVSSEEQADRLTKLYGQVDKEHVEHLSETLLDNARYDITINSSAKEGLDAMYREFDGKYLDLVRLGGAA